MNPGTAVVATTIVVVLGRWADDKKLSYNILVGSLFLAIMLSLMNETNPKLAGQFGLLILVGAVLVNGTSLFRAISKLTGTTGGAQGQATR
jgi:hypothetical protein